VNRFTPGHPGTALHLRAHAMRQGWCAHSHVGHCPQWTHDPWHSDLGNTVRNTAPVWQPPTTSHASVTAPPLSKPRIGPGRLPSDSAARQSPRA
jgi:hypothetical protein